MTHKPNIVLIPDDAQPAPVRPTGVLARLRTMATTAVAAAASASTALRSALAHAEPPAETGTPARPRLVFAVDATASREPAWAAARQVTDALVKGKLPSGWAESRLSGECWIMPLQNASDGGYRASQMVGWSNRRGNVG